MNYDTTNLDLLSIDTKKLDVCNDAKYALDCKLQKPPTLCLFCKHFVALYKGLYDVIGICGHVRSVSFYKSLVPGWGVCDYYERNTICKETHLDREG